MSIVSGSGPQTKGLEFRGFGSSRFLDSGCGIPRSSGDFPEIQAQRLLVCGIGRICAALCQSPVGRARRGFSCEPLEKQEMGPGWAE